ncbi:WYL domain-containing protein [Sorangium sp. So ce1389]|uniref:WYL domain-containing protein n=1 Tax=Sorangium sp. So ce1389 TaxID=3133336 RepID=UPI003F62C52F
MTAHGDQKGGTGTLERVLAVLDDLLQGKEHDRRSIAELGKVEPSTADRDIRLLTKVRGVSAVKEGKRKVLRFDQQKLLSRSPAPKNAAVIAACLGTSLASIFDGSSYESGMRDALAFILHRAKRGKKFRDIDRKFIFVRRGGEAALAEKAGELDDVIDALLRSRYATIDYCHFNGKREAIRIKPLSLAIYDHQLYVIGRPDTKPPYPYRFSRIMGVDVDQTAFSYPPRLDYDPDQVFQHSFGIFIGAEADATDVEVLLAPRWGTYAAAHRWHLTQKIEVREDGVLVRLHVKPCPELESWILSFGEEARVLKPASLASKIAGRVAAMAARHELVSRTVPPVGTSPSTRRRSRPQKPRTRR